MRVMDQIAEQYQEIVSNSYYDNLTELHNHGIFMQFLNWELKKYKRHAAGFVLALIDVDAFGFFNRRNGAIESDLILKNVAGIIRENIRESDLASRYAGDRFAVMLVGATAEGATAVAERIRTAVADMSDYRLTVSIGLASVSESNSLQADAIIRDAEAGLVAAKLQGKNRTAWHRKQPEAQNAPSGRVLVVDDEPLNLKLLEAALTSRGYEVVKAGSGPDALSVLSKTDIDLVLLDVMMPEMDGFEVCRRIKSREELRLIPVILVTGLGDVDSRVKGIEAGADDFLTKPPNMMELFARTKAFLKVKHLNQNMTSIENVLFSLANTVEAKDSYTQGHVRRVSELAIAVGRRLGRPESELEALRIGGALHDIGKIGVPKSVLNKQGKLEPDEWEAMKKHPEFGYNICYPLRKNLKQALDVIRHHHEKMDGSGYPDGLKGDEISMPSRIMTVADIYDALTTNRPYRKAMPQDKAISILQEEVDQGKLDGTVVSCLIELVTSRASLSEPAPVPVE
jgi:putative two-component system response regulator